jgi:hypothetical protein
MDGDGVEAEGNAREASTTITRLPEYDAVQSRK